MCILVIELKPKCKKNSDVRYVGEQWVKFRNMNHMLRQDRTKRKVQTHGSSLAITLPIGFCRYFEIKAGDSLELISDKELIIRPLKKGDSS